MFSYCPDLLRSHVIPPEIWESILMDICEEASERHEDSMFSFNAARDHLCLASDDFDRIIRSSVMFWLRLAISCDTTPDAVCRHLTCLGSASVKLDVKIILFPEYDSSTNAYTGQAASVPDFELPSYVRRATDSLLAAIPSAHLWSTAVISASTTHFMRPILAVFRNVYAPSLHSLSFVCPRNEAVCDRLFNIPPVMFGGILPGLTSLSLFNALLPWGNPGYFSGLKVFQIVELSDSLWPTYQQLVQTWQAAPSMHTLMVPSSGVNLGWDCPRPGSGAILPSLTSLTIDGSMGGNGIIVALVSLSLPALRHWTVRDLDCRCWDVALGLVGLRDLESLILQGRMDDSAHVAPLYTRLHSLALLDLHLGDNQYFHMLALDAGVCPSLRHLIVGDVLVHDLLIYVARRALHARLKLTHVESSCSVNISYAVGPRVLILVVSNLFDSWFEAVLALALR
ncbi:hypothetical protein DFH07DRAFT_775054 [Mycena maculata]|uniref:Uncharacterized protein n=1 Tax=Mycena maculata TaxID=230809 RepID=A0AAD7IUF1_9AGAR|nr:hypothetical protein DFH07DRAFT_775054 [Mycena maculata]